MQRFTFRLIVRAVGPVLLLSLAAGCQLSGPRTGFPPSTEGGPECQTCENGGPPERDYDAEVLAERASRPVGARKKFIKGKEWPPYPRPTGPQQTLAHRYHHAHYWPHPYVCQDRAFITTVSHLQTVNGWTEETTLYGYHFEDNSTEITHSGRLQLRWILENAPLEYRVVYVQNGDDTAISQNRLNSVRTELVDMVGEPNLPPIMLRVCASLGRPALEVDTIRRAELSSMPEPRITYEPLPTGAGGQ